MRIKRVKAGFYGMARLLQHLTFVHTLRTAPKRQSRHSKDKFQECGRCEGGKLQLTRGQTVKKTIHLEGIIENEIWKIAILEVTSKKLSTQSHILIHIPDK